MVKKKKISREEKIVENYFPVDETDLKYSIEKEYKKPNRENLEIVEKIKKSRKRSYSKKKSPNREGGEVLGRESIKNKKEYTPPKITLKKDGYELIITEKPQAALKISSALGKSNKKNLFGIPYYEIEKDGKNIVVACAVGHLFTLSQNESGEIPIFDISWMPNYMTRKNDFSKKYYDVLLKLAKNAGSLTVATDYDTEGEIIGLNIVRFICNQKDANRMKFSTLTNSELNKSYEDKSSSINWGQAIAGETRHYLDWFYGINLSRALMNAIKTTGSFKIMSIGRVQGPTLKLIVEKEREILNFKSKPYWQIFINVKNLAKEIFDCDRDLEDENKKSRHVKNSHILELKYIKDIFDKSELSKFENLKGKTGQAETKKTQQLLPPNPPFNLTTLQTEAYKFHGITPSITLRIAQSLYLSGLISYPRTSSQKLPSSIEYKSILQKLVKKYNIEKLITKEKPIEGKKSDPAHPSIYPTGQDEDSKTLTGNEEKIYNLIVKRFLALFCDDAIIDNKKINVKIDDLIFSTKGSLIRKKAWMEIYPSKLKEIKILDLNGQIKILKTRIEEKQTQPPKRYSQASIISELEKRNLGTKATRSIILDTLYNRNYITGKIIEATPLGISLIATLEKHSPIIIDEQLTKSFEQKMSSIIEAKKDFIEKEQKIINSAKRTITKISEDLKKEEKEIGKELLSANLELREQQRRENKLNICPVCKKGNLTIMYSKKTKRYFVACNAYPDCKNTYTLPPNGLVKKTEPLKYCEQCNFPKLILIKKAKRPWEFCFNPECKTNKKRIEEYRKNKSS